jgi:hypothetical protein
MSRVFIHEIGSRGMLYMLLNIEYFGQFTRFRFCMASQKCAEIARCKQCWWQRLFGRLRPGGTGQ